MRSILIILCILFSGGLLCQEVFPHIMSTTGGTYTSEQVSIDWTLGEILVDYIQSDDISISQGFHQPVSEEAEMELPDLKVRSLTLDNQCLNLGEDFVVVSTEIVNCGQAPIEGLAYHKIYLSKDSILDRSLDICLYETLSLNQDTGEVVNKRLFFDIPTDIDTGEWYLIFSVDDREQIEEADEGNNQVVIKIAIKDPSVNGPDLALLSMLIEDIPLFEGSEFIKLEIEVANLGVQPVDFDLFEIRLSSDTLISQEDSNLGLGLVSNLAPGDTVLTTSYINIPEDLAPGQWYILACLDDRDFIVELSESNNCGILPVTILDNNQRPDLAFINFALPSTTYFAGEKDIMNVEIVNQGGITSPFVFGDIYLSSDSIYDENATRLNSLFSSSLTAGAIDTSARFIRLPDDLSPGIYYIHGYIDDQDRVKEIDEENNFARFQIVILSQELAPDLRVLTSALIGQVCLGDTLYVSSTISNSGRSTTRESHLVAWLNKQMTIDSNAHYIGYIVLPSIDSQAEVSVDLKAFIPDTIGAGNWYLILEADGFKRLTELNDENNTRVLDIIIDECQNNVARGSMTTFTDQKWTQAEIKIYPNPAIDRIFISTSSDDVYTYQLIDISGRIIRSGDHQINSSIDISNIETGAYFLILQNGIKRRVELITKL